MSTFTAFKHATGQPKAVGVLMLDTRFPRLAGDVGCAQSFALPVMQHRVSGAFARSVVASADALRASDLLPRFIEGARALQRQGAEVITTSCGFLVLLQRELQEAVSVPLVSSSLLQLPALLAREPQAGVLTIDAASLGPEHLRAAGVPEERLRDVIVQGVDGEGEFARSILDDRETMDVARVRSELAAAARECAARTPGLRSLVLECTNMPPHARAIAQACGLRVLWLRHLPELRGAFADEEAA
jgi:aspartate/glutamate racemase